MTASPNIVSHGDSLVFTVNEPTAAERTWLFYLSNSADGTPATGKTISGADFKISKNGAAFANAAGTVTEISLGWYKMVWAAADLDTPGSLACELSGEAGVDTLHCVHRVQTLDVNVASSPADVLSAFQTAGATTGETKSLTKTFGPNTLLNAAESSYLGMENALEMLVSLTGTWDGSTVTLYTSENPQDGAGAVWTAVGSGAFTANGTKSIAGPHKAVKAAMTSPGAASSVEVKGVLRFAV